MKINRRDRFLSFLINTLVLITIIGIFVNIYLIFAKETTVGGMVMGYKHKFFEPVAGQLMYFVALIILGTLYGVTFGILWVVDICMMDKNKGNFAEKFAGCEKIKA